MGVRLADVGREFKRIRQTAREKIQLSRAGFQHVLSSNVSAVAESGKHLVIRFHGGATYQYTNAGDLFAKMLASNSKGSFVWTNLIRKQVPYKKIGSIKLQSDKQFTDRDLMAVAQKPLSPSMLIASLINKEQLIKKGIIATNIARLIKGY